jgi:hypothetical protein
MDKIHVGLYGGENIFGGREAPLRAEIVYCDKYNECDLYKKGKCLNVTDIFSKRCKFGRIDRIQGYTSRAAKYLKFKHNYQEDPEYLKLKYPNNSMIAMIGDFVYLKIRFFFERGDTIFLSKEKFNNEYIKIICDARPTACFTGGEIKKYQKEIVPEFLTQLYRYYREIYDKFIKEYPAYKIEHNYVGKMAFLRTMPECDVKDINWRFPKFNETWHWDGKNLTYKSGYVSDPFIAANRKFEVVNYVIKPDENFTVEITSNDQVDENTEFDE